MIKVIKVTLDNVAQLQRICRQTFSETYAAFNTEENMAKYIEEHFSLAKLTTELDHPLSHFYFAIQEKQVVGYLKLNMGSTQTDLKDDQALEIERIYVSQAFQRNNIGQLLLNKAIEIGHEIAIAYVWLGVWDKNERAINFYKKNGFLEFDRHAFILGAEKQIDILMKKVNEK